MGITGVATPLKQVVARWYAEASKARFHPTSSEQVVLGDLKGALVQAEATA